MINDEEPCSDECLDSRMKDGFELLSEDGDNYDTYNPQDFDAPDEMVEQSIRAWLDER